MTPLGRILAEIDEVTDLRDFRPITPAEIWAGMGFPEEYVTAVGDSTARLTIVEPVVELSPDIVEAFRSGMAAYEQTANPFERAVAKMREVRSC